MIYLYGITGPLTAELDASGLQGAALQAEEVGPLTAVYSVHHQLPARADADLCWAHEEAVEAVMRRQAILPARFGTTFSELDELRTAVARDAQPLAERLEQIEGCVELAVRINPPHPGNGQAGDGQRYLQDKLSAQRHREALAQSTLACLREFALDSRLAASSTQAETVSISYLVPADGIDRFSRAVGRLQRRWPEFALSCTGPWAPYSFVSGPSLTVRERAT